MTSAGPYRSRWRFARRLVRWVSLAIVVAILAVPVGFLWFTGRVPTQEVALTRDADGIVVLTGGASRITDAFELLAAGRGKRLLISGVHHTTTRREMARLIPEYGRLFACCVDLDYSAVNTVGNAVEAKRWVKDRGFRSLIVVTSSYHMPRTMAELEYRMADVELLPYPVVTERMRAEPWWSSLPTARLLFSEYLKYIAAQLRMRLDLDPAATGLAGGRNDHKG